MLASMRGSVGVATLLLLCCKKSEPGPPGVAQPSATSASGAPASAAPVAASASAPPLPTPGNPQKGRCRSRVTEATAIHGAGAFVRRDGKLQVAVNDDGIARFVDAGAGALKASRSPCAAAGEALYCASKKGIVRRVDGRGSVSVVAEDAAGASVAAARVGEDEVVAFLRAARTPAGVVREAWARTSQGHVVKISDDGAGATALDIVASDGRVTFVTVEARTSLATLTVRSGAIESGRLVLGPATIVFAGGGGDYLLEPRGVASSGGWLQIATVLPQDLRSFGSAVFIVAANRPANVEPTWSLYPRGLDNAAFAVTTHQGRTWMARVKPTSAESHSALAVELGQIDERGRFAVFGERPAPENPEHLALASDRDALVIYVDGDRGGQRERWVCGS